MMKTPQTEHAMRTLLIASILERLYGETALRAWATERAPLNGCDDTKRMIALLGQVSQEDLAVAFRILLARHGGAR